MVKSIIIRNKEKKLSDFLKKIKDIGKTTKKEEYIKREIEKLENKEEKNEKNNE